jgi:uncharacterized protein YggE
MRERTITVRGTGNVSAKPDLIIMEMNIEVTERDYAATLEGATGELDMLRAALASIGHDGKSLKTTSFNLQTKYESYKQKDGWKNRFTGYSCSHGLRLEFDLDMSTLGKTLGAIAECEAGLQCNIKFSVKDLASVKEQLIESAVKNATEKANCITQAAGVKLGAIQRMDYSWGELRLYSDTDMMVGEASATKAMALEIEPDDIDASDNMTVVWAIE